MTADYVQALWDLLTDPNVAYLLLVLGIWAAVLAYTVPGTGFPESAAVVALALAGLGLAQLPVNAAGLALIGLSVVLFLLELKYSAHGAFLIGGATSLAVGSVFLFRAGEGAVAISRWLIAAVTLGSMGFFGFAMAKALAAQKLPRAQSLDRVLGAHGQARTDIQDSGTVYVLGELWSARADDAILAGEEVEVVGREGLILKVAKARA